MSKKKKSHIILRVFKVLINILAIVPLLIILPVYHAIENDLFIWETF